MLRNPHFEFEATVPIKEPLILADSRFSSEKVLYLWTFFLGEKKDHLDRNHIGRFRNEPDAFEFTVKTRAVRCGFSYAVNTVCIHCIHCIHCILYSEWRRLDYRSIRWISSLSLERERFVLLPFLTIRRAAWRLPVRLVPKLWLTNLRSSICDVQLNDVPKTKERIPPNYCGPNPIVSQVDDIVLFIALAAVRQSLSPS